MAEETVTVGDTEVQITETDDGFEVTEVEDEPEEGLYLRAESNGGNYGFEVPLDSKVEIERRDWSTDPYRIAWNTDDDVADLEDDGHSSAKSDDPDLDGYAVLEKPEIVEH